MHIRCVRDHPALGHNMHLSVLGHGFRIQFNIDIHTCAAFSTGCCSAPPLGVGFPLLCGVLVENLLLALASPLPLLPACVPTPGLSTPDPMRTFRTDVGSGCACNLLALPAPMGHVATAVCECVYVRSLGMMLAAVRVCPAHTRIVTLLGPPEMRRPPNDDMGVRPMRGPHIRESKSMVGTNAP